ncbi:putative uncharacterized protein DDB_G0282133 [Teleopsis dalmanni]|uniref:putative uncharacterized protein DDB_G0282133 n=1 Tax=Teleopsis dalmanni TaxID=139649 RepID=UPI0018CFA8C4|nr:putative uncharacterized protein DDB_G0282133 [Teleopsis dalmanni]XP_037958157.1 putative uncharacterized protein DDB_G0282133 [Teleopsis dalmanni]
MAENIETLTEPVSDGSTIGSFDDTDNNPKFSTELSEFATEPGNCMENALAKEQKEQENDDAALGDQKSFRAASVVIKTSNFKLDIQNDVGRDHNSKQLQNTSRREYYRRASNKRRKNKQRNYRRSCIYRGNKTSDRIWDDNVPFYQTTRDDNTLLNRRDDKFTERDFRSSLKSYRDDQLAPRRDDNSSWYTNLDDEYSNKRSDDDLSSKRLDENSSLLKSYRVDSSQRRRDEEYINKHDKRLDERLEQYKKSYQSYRDNRLQKQRNDSSIRKISDDNVSLDKYCTDNSVSDKKRRDTGSRNQSGDDKLSFESNKDENLKTRYDDSDKSYMYHDDRFLYENYKNHNKSPKKFVDNNVTDKYQSSSKSSKNYQQQKERKKDTSSHDNSSSDRRSEYNRLKRRLDDSLLRGHVGENIFENDISVTKKGKYDKPLKKCDDDITNRCDMTTSLQRQRTIDIKQTNQEMNSPTKCVDSYYKYSDEEIAKSRYSEDKHKNTGCLTERSYSYKKRKRSEVGNHVDNPSKKYCEDNLLKKYYGNDDNQLSDDTFDEVHDDLASSHKVHNDTKQIKRRIDNVLQSLDSNETLSDETLNLKNCEDDISGKQVVNKSTKKHENINISLDKLRKYHKSSHKNIDADKDNVKDYLQNVSLDDDKSLKKLRKNLARSIKNRKNELKSKRNRKKHASDYSVHSDYELIEEQQTAINNSSYKICKDCQPKPKNHQNQIGNDFDDMFLEQIRRDVILSMQNRKKKELEAGNISSSSCPLREIFKDKSEEIRDDIVSEQHPTNNTSTNQRRTGGSTHSNQKNKENYKKEKTSFAVPSSDNYHESETLSYKECQSDEFQFEGEDILDLHDRDFCLSKQNADDNSSHKTGKVDIIGESELIGDNSCEQIFNFNTSDKSRVYLDDTFSKQKHADNNQQVDYNTKNQNLDTTPSYELQEDIVSLIKDLKIDLQQFDDKIENRYASSSLHKGLEDENLSHNVHKHSTFKNGSHDNNNSEKHYKKPLDTSHPNVTTSHRLFEINNFLVDDNCQSINHRTSEEIPGDKISSFEDSESRNDSNDNNNSDTQYRKPSNTSRQYVTTSHRLFEINNFLVDDNCQSINHRTSEKLPGDKISSFEDNESRNDSNDNNSSDTQYKKPSNTSRQHVTTSHRLFEINNFLVDDNCQSINHRTSEEIPGDKISSFKDDESKNDSRVSNNSKRQYKKPSNTSRQHVTTSHRFFEINNFLVDDNCQNINHRTSEELPGDKISSFENSESRNDSHDNNSSDTQYKKPSNTSRQHVTTSHRFFDINNFLVDENCQSINHRTSEEIPGDKISSFKDDESKNDSRVSNNSKRQYKKPSNTSRQHVTTSHRFFEINNFLVDDNCQNINHRTSEELPGDKISSFENSESRNDSHDNNSSDTQYKKPSNTSRQHVTTSHRFFDINNFLVDENCQSINHRTSEEIPGDKISSFKDDESKNGSHDNKSSKRHHKKPSNTSHPDMTTPHEFFEINSSLVDDNHRKKSHRTSEELTGDKISAFKGDDSENGSHDHNRSEKQYKKPLNTPRQDVTASLSSHKEHLKNKNKKQCDKDMTLSLKNYNGDSLNSNIHNNNKPCNHWEDKITSRKKSVSNTGEENDHTSKTRSDYDRSTNSYGESSVSIRNISCKQSEYDNRKIRENGANSRRLTSRDDNYSNQNESVKWDCTSSNARNSYSSQYDIRTSFSTSNKNNICDDSSYGQYRNSSGYRYKHDDKYKSYDSRNGNNFVRRYDDVYNDKRRRQDREERRRREEEELQKRREERKKRHAALEKINNNEEDKYKTELKKENKHAEQQKQRGQDKSVIGYKDKAECKKDSTEQPGVSSRKESITQEHAVSSNKTSITKKQAVNSNKKPITKEATNDATFTDRQARITSSTSRAKRPPTKLRMTQDKTTDKSSAEYQRIAWEALKKSIYGQITKIDVDNVLIISHVLLREDIVRGRNLFCRSILLIQAEHSDLTNAYAALVAIINSRFPNIGELLLKRLIFQFKIAYSRNDKRKCVTVSSFIGDLINQKVAHGVLGFELLTLLIETPTDDSVEIAIDFLKQCGIRLSEVSITAVDSAFKSLKNALVKSKLHKRIQYMIEGIFQIRKNGFRNHPPIIKKLDLVEDMDQFTHRLVLNPPERYETAEAFSNDDEYKSNEKVYKTPLSSSSSHHSKDRTSDRFDNSDSNNSSSSNDDNDDGNKNRQKIIISFHRTIYLLIKSTKDYEECVHMIMELNLKPEHEMELCKAIVYYCAEHQNYTKYCGLMSKKLCTIDTAYVSLFERVFTDTFNNVNRFDACHLANACKFLAHLLYTDVISWNVLEHLHLNEFETSSTNRLFIKILFKQLTENMGFKKLNAKLNQDEVKDRVTRIFPIYCQQDALFSINFFTSIGLRGLIHELRLFLNSSPHYKSGIKSKISAIEKEKSGSVKKTINLSSSTDSSRSCSTSVSSSSETDSKILAIKKGKRKQLKNTGASSSTKMLKYSTLSDTDSEILAIRKGKLAASLSLKTKIKRGKSKPLKNVNNLSSSKFSKSMTRPSSSSSESIPEILVIKKGKPKQSKNTDVSSSTKSSGSSSSSSSDSGSENSLKNTDSSSSTSSSENTLSSPLHNSSKILAAKKKKSESLENTDDNSSSSTESSGTDSSSSSDESRSDSALYYNRDQKFEVNSQNVIIIKKDSSEQESKDSTSESDENICQTVALMAEVHVEIQLPMMRGEKP